MFAVSSALRRRRLTDCRRLQYTHAPRGRHLKIIVRTIVVFYRRFAHIIHELFKFGAVGVASTIVTFGVSNLLWHAFGAGALTGSVIATVVATIVAFAGNRYWTFRHRNRTGLAREYFLFFVLNGIGLLIQLLCLGFTVYTLKLDGLWARNISNNVIGLGLGTLFRYWSYKKFVFLPPYAPPVDPHTGLPEADESTDTDTTGTEAAGTETTGTEATAAPDRLGTRRLNGHPLTPESDITRDR